MNKEDDDTAVRVVLPIAVIFLAAITIAVLVLLAAESFVDKDPTLDTPGELLVKEFIKEDEVHKQARIAESERKIEEHREQFYEETYQNMTLEEKEQRIQGIKEEYSFCERLQNHDYPDYTPEERAAMIEFRNKLNAMERNEFEETYTRGPSSGKYFFGIKSGAPMPTITTRVEYDAVYLVQCKAQGIDVADQSKYW